MSIRREWINRLLHLGRRPEFENDLDEEIRFHLETRAAELRDTGLSEREAHFRARKEFGPIARMQEGSRAAWQLRWLCDFGADAAYAFRTLRRAPGFAATAILSLGLGIGATAAIFSAMDAALWRPLPVRQPERLMRLALTRSGVGIEDDLPAAFVPMLRQSEVFDGVLTTGGDGLSFTYDGRAERIVAEMVSPDYFDVLEAPGFLGQQFTAETRAGRWAAEAVLSYSFWQRRFGGDPAAIGRTIRLNTVSFTIVGVSPPEFTGVMRGRDYELRIPMLPEGRAIPEIAVLSGSPNNWVNVMARLKPGVTPVQAEAWVDSRLQEFLRTTTIPRFRKAGIAHARVLPGGGGWQEDLETFSTPLYVLLALVGLVLLIACANLAGILLARATARSRELAIRCSIGAGRLRLVRQMLAESLLLALLGGAAGVAVADPAARLLLRLLPQGHVGLVVNIRTDGRVLLFTFALSVATGLVFGLMPAIQATRGDLASVLKAVSTGATGGTRVRRLLVAAQVAFSLVLLASTGVFLRTLAGLQPAEYRLTAERTLLFTMKPQPELYPPDRMQALTAELTRRISALPGVQAAALAEAGPLGSRDAHNSVTGPDGHSIRATSDTVTAGFFETVGIRRIAGRDFGTADRAGAPLVAIVNQSLARALYPNESPLGRTFTVPAGKEDGQYEIVGVVEDTHYYAVQRRPEPGMWIPSTQAGFYMPTLLVRAAGAETGSVMAQVRHEFDGIDRGFPVFNVRTLAARIGDSMARERMMADFSAALALLALLMAAVGLYGVLAYAVMRRTREIGVRMALGSGAGRVLWLVAVDAVQVVAAGCAAGIVVSLAGHRVLLRYVASVAPMSWDVWGAALGFLCAIAAGAVAIPALRACRVNPVTALRCE